MKFKVTVRLVTKHSQMIEAESREQAKQKAQELADEIYVKDETNPDYVDVDSIDLVEENKPSV